MRGPFLSQEEPACATDKTVDGTHISMKTFRNKGLEKIPEGFKDLDYEDDVRFNAPRIDRNA